MISYQNFSRYTISPQWFEEYKNIKFSERIDFQKILLDRRFAVNSVPANILANGDIVSSIEKSCKGLRKFNLNTLNQPLKSAVHIETFDKFRTNESWVFNSEVYKQSVIRQQVRFQVDTDLNQLNQYLNLSDQYNRLESLIESLCQSYSMTRKSLTEIASNEYLEAVSMVPYRITYSLDRSYRYVFGTAEGLDIENKKKINRAGRFLAPTYFYLASIQYRKNGAYKVLMNEPANDFLINDYQLDVTTNSTVTTQTNFSSTTLDDSFRDNDIQLLRKRLELLQLNTDLVRVANENDNSDVDQVERKQVLYKLAGQYRLISLRLLQTVAQSEAVIEKLNQQIRTLNVILSRPVNSKITNEWIEVVR